MKKIKGFTLIELLAVIIIIGVLLLIIVPGVSDIIQRQSKKIYTASMKGILRSATDYYTEFSDNINDGECFDVTDGVIPIEKGAQIKAGSICFYDSIPVLENVTDGKFCAFGDNKALEVTEGSECDTRPTLVAGNTGGISATSRYLTTDTSQTLLRQDIETVEIVNHKTIPGSAVGSYDVSTTKDGSYMLWYTLGSSTGCGASGTSQCYKVYIGAVGGVYANDNSSYLFSNLRKATSINVSYLNTSKVTNMGYMFGITSSAHVYSTGYSCVDSSSLITGLNLSNFNTSKVSNMNSMFQCLKNLSSLNISSFNTSKVTNMSGMFIGLNNLNLDVSNFDTSNVTNMSAMFPGIANSTLDLSNFNTSKVTNMGSMFYAMPNLTTIITSAGANKINFDTSKVTDMVQMFALTKLTSLEFGNKFVTTNVKNMGQMFGGMTNLTVIKHTGGANNVLNFDTSKVIWMNGMFGGSGLSTIEFGPDFITGSVTNMEDMFSGMTNLTVIKHTGGANNIINFDTSAVETMGYMFVDTRLSTIEFGLNFVTSNVTEMNYMFSEMTNLTVIKHTGGANNVLNFDTSKVTDMRMMFVSTKLTSIEFGPNFVTSNVKYMGSMFDGMTNLTVIKHTGGVDNVLNFNTSKVTDMSSMFYNTKLTSLEFGSNFVTSNVNDMDEMFAGMTQLNSTTGLDLRYFVFTNVTAYYMMFGSWSGTVPTTAKITVNTAGNTWLNSHGYSAWNNRTIVP